jgi:hypothetical protein
MIRQDQTSGAFLDLRNQATADRIRESRSFADDSRSSAAPSVSREKLISRAKLSSVMRPFCGQLRMHFGDVAAEPMPDRLATLTDQLQAALERGDLFPRSSGGPER